MIGFGCMNEGLFSSDWLDKVLSVWKMNCSMWCWVHDGWFCSVQDKEPKLLFGSG